MPQSLVHFPLYSDNFSVISATITVGVCRVLKGIKGNQFDFKCIHVFTVAYSFTHFNKRICKYIYNSYTYNNLFYDKPV